MNFVKNGSFETGNLGPWRMTGDGSPEEIIYTPYQDGHAALLKSGMRIVQTLSHEEIGDTRDFILKISTRASVEPQSAPQQIQTYFYMGLELWSDSTIDGPGFGAIAYGGMTETVYHYSRHFTLPLTQAYIIIHIIPNNPGGPLDPRDIWVTGIELIAAPPK